MHELPLILFTLLLQCSVGMTIGLALTHRRAEKIVDVRRRMQWPLGISFILAAIGLTASTLHLGYPLNAFNALRHFGSSWLSREIIFASFYLAALGLSIVFAFVRKPGWQFLLWLAALVGAVDVFCMAQIYIHTGVISWQHINTLVMFAGTAGTLGALALTALRGFDILPSQVVSLRWVLGIIVIIMLIRLLMQPVWVHDITAAAPPSVTFPHSPMHQLQQLRDVHIAGWCLGVAGLVCFACGVRRNAASLWLVTGGVLLHVAEVVLRSVFFSIG